MRGIDLFNLRQLQDIRNFLSGNDGSTVPELIASLEERIAGRSQEGEMVQLAHGKPGVRQCPDCKGVMRLEQKGDEAVWHCLACRYSEYLGFVRRQ